MKSIVESKDATPTISSNLYESHKSGFIESAESMTIKMNSIQDSRMS